MTRSVGSGPGRDRQRSSSLAGGVHLLPEPERSVTGYRIYREDAAERLEARA